ncbi:MAG: hypothetical protein KF720_01820 [Rubrivivax sp.]|nr:hypothetical protein [Rubrivivax sp.]
MSDALSKALKAHEARSPSPDTLRLAFSLECAERVRHLLEDPYVVRCLDTLAAYVAGRVDRATLDMAATEAAALATRHRGSASLDGVGHAAVSASYAVANALAARALQAAEYAAYAMVYASGGYGAVGDPDSFLPETSWQLAKLDQVAQDA